MFNQHLPSLPHFFLSRIISFIRNFIQYKATVSLSLPLPLSQSIHVLLRCQRRETLLSRSFSLKAAGSNKIRALSHSPIRAKAAIVLTRIATALFSFSVLDQFHFCVELSHSKRFFHN